MKKISKDWLIAANDDLIAAKTLVTNEQLTHIAAFHCQQCIEKSLKAMIEELNLQSVRSHDLLRLQKIAGISVSEKEQTLLAIINEVYIDSRYPGDLGLLPHGKPTIKEVNKFIKLCENFIDKVRSSENQK